MWRRWYLNKPRLCQEGMNVFDRCGSSLSPLPILPISYGSIWSPFCHRKPSLVFLFQVPLTLSLFLSMKCWLECLVILCSRCVSVHLSLQLLWLFSKSGACCHTLPYDLVKVITFLSLKLRERLRQRISSYFEFIDVRNCIRLYEN